MLYFLFIFFAIAFVIRYAADGFDRDRIRNYVQERGGTVLEIHWDPFGPGWFGEKSDRIYEVFFLDSESNKHRANCKTSAWTGVYFTEDVIVEAARPLSFVQPELSRAELEEENRQLKAELARLKHTRQ